MPDPLQDVMLERARQETMQKLFGCSGMVTGEASVPEAAIQRLGAQAERHAKATVSRSLEQNSVHFNNARDKLEKWAVHHPLGGRVSYVGVRLISEGRGKR